jgi:ribosome-binding factor A
MRPFISVSAKTGVGIDELLENVLLQAEVLELKAPKESPAKGLIIEARLDKGRGPVATMLVQSGTLRQGDVVLAGQVFGRVRAMLDENGKVIKEAGPSIPVEILGLSDVPAAGQEAVVLADERKAREIALFRQGKYRDVKLATKQAANLENILDQMTEAEAKVLALIIKADVQGSQEALVQSLQKLSTARSRSTSSTPRSARSASPTCIWRKPRRRSSSVSTRVPMPARARRPKRRGRYPLLQHHLRCGRRSEGRAVRHAVAREARRYHRPGRDPAGLPRHPDRHHCRLLRARRRHQAQLACPPAAQQRRRLGRRTRVAQALQGRRQGSARRLRMRSVAEELQRLRRGRPARSVRCDGSCADALSASQQGVFRAGPDLEQIRRELAEVIRTELVDPRVGMISLTDVEVTPITRMPRSSSAAWPAARHLDSVMTGLQKAAGFLRSELGKRISIHTTPQLHFVFDESLERGAELSKLISEAVAISDQTDPHGAEPEP